jgi:hypothetical protein
VGTAAPVVPATATNSVTFTNAGTSIAVPTGGYVTIQNLKPPG